MALAPEQFAALVREALLNIPERFRNLMENVAIVIEEESRPEQNEEVGIRYGEVLLGLYQGVPRTARGPHYNLALPDKITIFKTPIELLGQTPDGIRALVRDTVWHEVAHHFGLNDVRIHKAAAKRKRRHAP